MAIPSIPTNRGNALPFSCYLDTDGNVWASAGPVIAIHPSGTVTFKVGGGGRGMVPFQTGEDITPAAGVTAAFKGGNGTNLEAEPGTPITGGTLVPYGRFRAVAENQYTAEGNPDFTVEWDAGDGSATISDHADVVATLGAGSPIPRSDTFTATPYGETTYNSGNPWTIDLDYEGAANAWPNRTAIVAVDDGATAQAGGYARTGWQSWESADDPSWTAVLDGAGAGELSDGVDVVAERAADANRMWDPTGEWPATAYGMATYGTGVSVTAATVTAGTFPEQAYRLVTTEAGIEYHVGVTDLTKSIELDTATGNALLKDGTDTVAERLGGSLVTIDGVYPATAYGEETYNGLAAWDYTLATATEGQAFTIRVGLARGVPAEGVLYAKLTIDGSDEVTAAEGPFWATSLPANTATEIYLPILESDGVGGVEQQQLGPIYWRPNP